MDTADDANEPRDTGSLKDVVVIGGSESSGITTPLSDELVPDDSIDSLSRKTSTASEYTSLSDYTPEHTVNTATVGSTSSSQAATVSALFRADAVPPLPIDTVEPEDVPAPIQPPKSVATRKISRFLVSPAIMTVGELNLDPSSAQSLASAIASASASAVAYQPVLDMLESGLYNPLDSMNSAEATLPVTTAQDMLDATNVLLAANNSNLAPRPPDQINTLEQLKIGLENITHAHVMQSQQQRKDAAVALQLADEQQQLLMEADQPAVEQFPVMEAPPAVPELPMADPSVYANSIEQPLPPVAVQAQQQSTPHPLQHPQSQPQPQQPQPQSQPQQQQSSGSQNPSVFNSRRTSADMASNDNTPTSYESSAVAVNAVQSEPALPQSQQRVRMAVQQSSVDNSDG